MWAYVAGLPGDMVPVSLARCEHLDVRTILGPLVIRRHGRCAQYPRAFRLQKRGGLYFHE